MDWPGIFIGAGITTLIALAIAWYQRRPKQLRYRVMANTPILNPKAESRGDLSLSFEGREVGDARAFTLRVANTGKVPIRRDDFEGHLTVRFEPEDARLLSVEVTDHSEGLRIDVPPSPTNTTDAYREVAIEPLLMNPKDWLDIGALVENANGHVGLDARIAGVSAIEDYGTKVTRRRSVIPATLALGLVVSLLISVGMTIGVEWEVVGKVFGGAAFGAIAVLFFASMDRATSRIARRNPLSGEHRPDRDS